VIGFVWKRAPLLEDIRRFFLHPLRPFPLLRAQLIYYGKGMCSCRFKKLLLEFNLGNISFRGSSHAGLLSGDFMLLKIISTSFGKEDPFPHRFNTALFGKA
jgi:hypothetical protein